ncbi:DUF7522 family protein [Halorussus halophilus]|uniref:DUF7522 family protein n=1 Tax=Halorussus halophilus TaxID=2650975 RepID=UPI00130166DF|nr:hypothetical protein [Halorussus halophilus]
MTPNLDNFVAFLHERTSGSLRAVRFYTSQSHRSLYARDDVRERLSDRDIDRFVARAREELAECDDDVWWFTAGDLEATVRVFRESVIVNLLVSKEYGILVSLDASVASQLNTFIDDCREWLTDT